MAAPVTVADEDQYLDFFDDYREFETDIDETDAINDIDDVVLSDEEFIVDIDALNNVNADVSSCEPTIAQPSTQNINPNLACPTCHRQYKKQRFLDIHKTKCTGKRKYAGQQKRKADAISRPNNQGELKIYLLYI